MNAPRRPFRAAAFVALATTSLLLLTACTATESGPTNSGDANKPKASVAAPAGIPSGICESLTGKISTLTDGLYLNTDSSEGAGLTVCLWSDVPLDTSSLISSGQTTALDLVVRINFQENFPPEKAAALNKHGGSVCRVGEGTVTEAGMAAFSGEGECAGGSLRYATPEDSGVWASVPYYDLMIATTCNLSTACAPTLPASFTDEVAYQALRSIADELASKAAEPENAAPKPADEDVPSGSSSDPSAGVALVRDWGKAGFPSPSEKPGWYCEFWTDKDTQEANRIAQIKENPGWNWKVEDELDRELGLPRAILVIEGPASESQQAANPEIRYNVTLAPDNGKWCLGGVKAKGVTD